MQRRTASAAWRSVSLSMDLHDHREGQAPRGDLRGTSGGRMQIGEELVVIEGAELGAERHGEMPFGARGLYRGRRGFWDGR
jgi:hypothetical protein